MSRFRSHSFFGSMDVETTDFPPMPMFTTKTTTKYAPDKSERLISVREIEDWYNVLNDFLTEDSGIGEPELEELRDKLYSYLRG